MFKQIGMWALMAALSSAPIMLHAQDDQSDEQEQPFTTDQEITSEQMKNMEKTNVVPVPEVSDKYGNNPASVNTIIINNNGDVTTANYPYDPDQGGIVINNNVDVGGPGCSLFFPGFGVGFLWYNGFWCDGLGYYWNGFGWGFCGFGGWPGYWHGYWYHHWSRSWHHYYSHHYHSAHFHYHHDYNHFSGRARHTGHGGTPGHGGHTHGHGGGHHGGGSHPHGHGGGHGGGHGRK